MAGQAILAVSVLLLFVRVLGLDLAAVRFRFVVFPSILHRRKKNGNGELVTYLNYKWLVDVFLGGIIGVGLLLQNTTDASGAGLGLRWRP